MTTYTDFNPSAVTSPPFQFSAMLDTVPYKVALTWSTYAQRWYVTITALDGTVILYTARVSSPSPLPIAALSWDDGEAEIETVDPHGFTIGSVATLTVSGATPIGYNGLVQCVVTGPSTLTYPLGTDPGTATVFGTAAQNVNMIGGVPNANGVPFSSSLVYREAANQFEVSP